MFRKQQPQILPAVSETDLLNARLLNTYTAYCAKTCLEDFNGGLMQAEKKCLSKCLDRSADFLKLMKDKLDYIPPTKKGRQ